VPGCAVEVATDRASRRRCPWARLSSQPRSGFGALQLGLVPTTRLVPMRARSSRPDASQAELCSAERAMRHHGGRGARRAVRPAGFGEDHVLPRVDATGVALCRTPLPPDRGRIGLRPRATGLVGSLVGSLRHGTRCTGPHQMDDGANRTAAQGTGQGTMDERIWTPNPQVLGSNPRGRTRKSPGQRPAGRLEQLHRLGCHWRDTDAIQVLFYAVLDCARTIERAHLDAACALWGYARTKSKYRVGATDQA
jgi:hypothetical protein